MSLWATIATLTRKDLRLFFRDRTAVALGFLLPLALVFIFGFVMGNVGGGDDALPAIEIAVADRDASPASRALVAALQDSEMLDARLPPPAADGTPGAWSAEDCRGFVRDGDRPVALLIPPGFGEGRAELELFVDPGRTLERRMVDIALMQALFQAQGPDAAWGMSRRALLKAGLPDAWADRITALTGGFRNGIEAMFREAESSGLLHEDEGVDDAVGADDAAGTGAASKDATGRAVAADGARPDVAAKQKGPDIGAFLQDLLPVTRTEVAPEGRQQQITYMVSHAVSGMTVMMLLFSLVGLSRSLIEERANGTLRRLLAAPIEPRALLLSKLLTNILVGMLLIAALFTFASLAFHLDVLSRWDTLLVLSFATALACTSFALVIACWAKTDKQADGVSTLLILVMAPLGGCWMPLMLLPEPVRIAARFTLPYWSVVGFQGTFWYGLHWTDPAMLLPIGVLLGIAGVLLLVAHRLFRARYLAG